MPSSPPHRRAPPGPLTLLATTWLLACDGDQQDRSHTSSVRLRPCWEALRIPRTPTPAPRGVLSAEEAALTIEAGATLHGAAAADLDQDGCGDLLLWSYLWSTDPDGTEFPGAAWALAGPLVGEVELDEGAWTARVSGADPEDALGAQARWGDLSGDGVPELVVSDIGLEGTVGAVHLFELPPGGTGTVADAKASVTGVGRHAGWAMDLGDLDGDGTLDLALADDAPGDAPNPDGHAIYLHLGPITGSIGPDSAAAIIYEPEEERQGLGSSVSASVDLDGDGVSELVIGQPKGGRYWAGRVYVYEGPPAGVVSEDAADVVVEGLDDDGQLGGSVSVGGDLDGDGHPDVAAGAHTADVGTRGGAVYLFYGPPGEQWSIDTPGAVVATWEERARLGISVSIDQDLDGDGCADLAAGATESQAYAPRTGAVYLFYGALSGSYDAYPDADAILHSPMSHPETSSSGIGDRVFGIGDLDGDGFDELFVGGVEAADGYVLFGGL